MFRTILVGLGALGAAGAVLGMIFAIGMLRLHLADSGPVPPAVADTEPVNAPSPAPASQPAATTADESADALPVVSLESIDLLAEQATLGPGLRLDDWTIPQPHKNKHSKTPADPKPPAVIHQIVGWRTADQAAKWTLNLPAGRRYEVDLIYATDYKKSGGAEYVVSLGDKELTRELRCTTGPHTYQMITFGIVELPAGTTTLRVHAAGGTSRFPLVVRGVRLIPAM